MEAWYKSEKVQKRHHLEVSELAPPFDVKEFDRFCQRLNNWLLITKDYTIQKERKTQTRAFRLHFTCNTAQACKNTLKSVMSH